jgi:succinoglycan biosynthesis protein ExoA
MSNQAAMPHEADLVPPVISVIVPVRNEAEHIERVLRALVGQSYPTPRFEILVIDGESVDATREIVAEFSRNHPQVRLLSNPRRLSSSARNIGVKAAQGELIVLVDGHCHFDSKTYLAEVAEAFERSGADCLGRPQPLDVNGATRLQRAIAAARSSPLGHHPASWIYAAGERFVPAASVAAAYRRSVFDRIGNFDESFDACEDYEFNHRADRAGLRCFFRDRIALHYAPRGSFSGLFRQLWRYGRGRVRLFAKHPDTARMATAVPAIFVLGLAAGAFLIGLDSPIAPLVWAGMAIYCAALAGFSVSAARAHRAWELLPPLPAVFVTIHLACGTGMVWEALSRLRKRSVPRVL